MRDLNRTQIRPETETYFNVEKVDSINNVLSETERSLEFLWEQKSGIENKIILAKNKHNSAKKSFDNWINTRKTIGSNKQDEEVISRANELDKLYKIEQNLRTKKLSIESELKTLNKKIEQLHEQSYDEELIAENKRNIAYKKYELNVFLTRLLFVLPMLLIGIWFIVKFRKNKYWPLFLGFVLYSFYAFFFGLLPYLPSYGGYVRHTVGIILSVCFGIYFITIIRKFVERKKQELTASQKERSKTVKIDTAEKALDNHMCPSCGKDFILTKWDKSNNGKLSKTMLIGLATNYCRFCGLELFKNCKSCDTENFAHLPFCSKCGVNINDK